MNVWMVWLKNGDRIWLERTWSGPADSPSWHRIVEGTRRVAHDHGYDIRIQLVDVPGVHELFESPHATAQAKPMDWKMWGPESPLPVEATS